MFRMTCIEMQCRAKGLILTGQRRLIAQVIAEAKDHPDAQELHRRVAERDSRVSRGTVYRTLKLLASEGIIECHTFRDGRLRCESAAREHHDHLIDLETGEIVDFSDPEIERLQHQIAGQLGYRLVGHRLEVYAARLKARGQ
jgi:Fur family transcriptional regulator, ferric uptake regulator